MATSNGASNYATVLGGHQTGSGMVVTPETALKISTVWACVGLLADCVAMLPLVMYRRLPNGGRERVDNHPLSYPLHTLPNSKQTAIEFRSMMQGHLMLRGNAYARIVPGPRGPVDELIPIHPDRVTIEALPDGGARYRVAGDRVYNDEDILHVKGLSLDGVRGLSFVEHARETIGLSLAGERSRAKFFGNGSRVMGVLKTPGKLSKDGGARIKASWEAAQSGVENSFRTAVLEEGLEWQDIGLNYKDAQFIEGSEFTAEDIARWLRVPPHMIGLTSKATSWGSGIEQMGIGFVTYTLMPWLIRWTQAISRDLIIAPQLYFAEFITDALLRGDTLSRYNAYSIARSIGVLNANDIRKLENMNPRTDPGGDRYLDTPVGGSPPLPSTGSGNGSPTGAHYEQLLYQSAARVVRKEIAFLTKLNSRLPEQSTEWLKAAMEFYGTHAAFVAQTLQIDPALADEYTAKRVTELSEIGAGEMATWEQYGAADLVGMVLHDK